MVITRINAAWFMREMRAARKLGKRDPLGRWTVLVSPRGKCALGAFSGFYLWFAGMRDVRDKAGKLLRRGPLPLPLVVEGQQ